MFVKNKKQSEAMSLWRLAAKRFTKNKLAMAGLYILSAIVIICTVGPLFLPYGMNDTNLINIDMPPSLAHPLGTDNVGRDVLTRLLIGGRYSLLIGLASEVVALIIGVVMGILAGYFGKFVDSVIMRLVDILMCLPYLAMLIIISSFLSDLKVRPEYRIYIVMFIIGVLGWAGLARIVRGEILALREQEFMQAAEVLGLSDMRKMFRHLLPNVMAPIIVTATLGIGGAILSESALSFLGLGVIPPTPSWGQMIQMGRDSYNLAYRLWLWVPPSICILLTVMSINLVGDGLRDALDPKLKN